jgi:hypothetical protein
VGRKVAPAARPADPARRRSGGVLRFFQVFLSVVVLVVAPLVALVAAYSVSAGVPMESSIDYLVDDLSRLVR